MNDLLDRTRSALRHQYAYDAQFAQTTLAQTVVEVIQPLLRNHVWEGDEYPLEWLVAGMEIHEFGDDEYEDIEVSEGEYWDSDPEF